MKAPCFLIPALFANFAIAAPVTQCGSGETTFFSCSIVDSQRIASLCGSVVGTDGSAWWFQYRFGPLGRPEMVYPKERKDSREKFFAHFESHPGGSFGEIWFKAGAYRYLVASDQAAIRGDDVDYHIVVYKGWQPIANLKCATTFVDDLNSLRGRIFDANDNGFYDQK